jgi:hypothetical protein
LIQLTLSCYLSCKIDQNRLLLYQFGEKDERTLYAMKHMACYLQHDNQHIESLRLYETICQVRQKNLEDSKELFVTDQINHGIAMTKAYKYRRDRPDSPRMLIPKNLLYDAVRYIHCMCEFSNSIHVRLGQFFHKAPQ